MQKANIVCFHNPSREPCRSAPNHNEPAAVLCEQEIQAYKSVLRTFREWLLIFINTDEDSCEGDISEVMQIVDQEDGFALVWNDPKENPDDMAMRVYVSTYREYGIDLPLEISGPLQVRFEFPYDYSKLCLELPFNPRTFIFQFFIADFVKLLAIALPERICYLENPNLADPPAFLSLMTWPSESVNFAFYQDNEELSVPEVRKLIEDNQFSELRPQTSYKSQHREPPKKGHAWNCSVL